MTCGCEKDKPKSKGKAFTKAVVEINNPSKITTLRKVIIPTSLGDEETIPPAIGAYHNVILYYEASQNIYLYSSDGIPTLVTPDLSDIEEAIAELQEALEAEAEIREETDEQLSNDISDLASDLNNEIDAREAADNALDARITDNSTRISGLTNSLVDEINNRQNADVNLQSQIDAITASSDVRDIVGTYAALQNYDTSTLGNNDIIKVLQDETQDGATTYYRWDAATNSFELIGEEGPYYTKSQADALLDAKQDNLTAGENIQITGTTISATDTTYSAGNGINLTGTTFSADTSVMQEKLTAGQNISINNNTISATDTTYTAGAGLELDGTTFSVDTDVIQPLLTFDSTPTAGSNNPVTSDGIKDYVDNNSITFKPYPATVNTTGTTAQFISSIQALNAPTGMAYLGTVELSDLPAQLEEADVEVYIHDDNVIYCVLRDSGAPQYIWWASSRNYQGWRPVDTTYSAGNGLNLTGTTFSVDTTAIQEKLTAGNNVSINNNVISATDTTYSAGEGLYMTGTVISANTDFLATQADLDTKQDILTAGNNITIENDIISAIDTTYEEFTGADGTAAGTSGLVPAPAPTDNTKYLSGDGTWKAITPYSLPIASSSTLGGIKVGNNLSIDSAGVLSAADTIYTAGTGLQLNGNQFSIDNTVALKSEIPTVNDATLTIQKNSTTVDTFTANASQNKTINITVPTTAADVSALPASTKYGARIGVSINTTDYSLTTTLLDQDGNVLGTAQTVDLPLESVVVSGTYDSANKKIVLTLQNGNTIDIPVGDLVAGLQTELSATNKLNADYIEDGNTNKVVTATEKATWNAKQNALTPGDNITITGNIISATDTIYTLPTASADTLGGIKVGNNLSITDGVLSADVQPAVLYSSTGQNTDGAMTQKATTDALGLKANSADLATVATSGSYNDLSNKPTIPTVNNATLTIQKNSSTIDTFTANASVNKTIDITVPTKVSDLTNDTGFITEVEWDDIIDRPSLATVATTGSYNDLLNKPAIPAAQIQSDWAQTNTTAKDFIKNKPALATVATSGDYDDLANKPTIPTVNNATITIQKNSSTIDSFTANQATAKTINITVPTNASDVAALPSSTKYAAAISLSIDQSTYDITAQLKDQDGNNLGAAQTIELPLESVVVSGTYDSVNKKIVLTLKDGSTIDIPVADLVAGLQPEITSTNKLSADLVDDTSTANKFVTASEKTTWSGKQDALTAGNNIQITGTTISATDTTYNDFTGATSSAAGAHGLVPAPASGDTNKYLKSDGTWSTVSEFSLPIASSSTLGGIKVGSGLSIDPSTGVLTATGTSMILYPTTGQNTDGAMTQKATTDALGLKANTADLATVATSGSYNDLSNKPTIPAAQVQSDWTQTTTTAVDFIKNKPSLAAVATSGSYNDLSNKPTIPTVPTNVSAFTNDANYQNSTQVNSAIASAIGDITELDYQVVQALPATGVKGTIYLVPNAGSAPDTYDEYIWIPSGTGGSFEKIGNTDIDLSDYVTDTELATALSNYTTTANLATVATTGSYNDLSNRPSIPTAGTTATAVSTTSSGGSATTWSKSDHVHSLSSSTITSALGYTPYDSTNPNGYTSNTGTITSVQANGTTVASSGTANIPAATTSAYGVTKLSTATNSTSTVLAATPSAVKAAYDLANGKQDPLTAGTGISITNGAITNRSGLTFYGTSSTAAGTAAKVVTCNDFTASDLVAGTRLIVLFTNANSYNGQATLNVNGTGAKNIYYTGTTTNARYMWTAGESVEFVYNGTQWAMVNGGLANTTYYGVTKLYTGAASNSTTLALTPNSLYAFANQSIAPYYSASSTYAVGDKVRHGYLLYECNTAITTAEAWNAEHWTALATLQEQLDEKAEILVTDVDPGEDVALEEGHFIGVYGSGTSMDVFTTNEWNALWA